jgi:NADPH2:quinone reductase
MAFPWVIPHQDGACTIDAVGEGVPTDRVGECVWVYEATWNRPGGTTASVALCPLDARLPCLTAWTSTPEPYSGFRP